MQPTSATYTKPSIAAHSRRRPLLILACSAAKLDRPAPALELYQGVMYQTFRAHARRDSLPHVVVLSARHGFIRSDAVIAPYEQRMTEVQADLMTAHFRAFNDPAAWPQSEASTIFLAGGAEYRRVMLAAVNHLAGIGRVSRRTIIRETSGGIGVQRAQLGRFLDGLASDFREQIGAAPNGVPRFASYGGLRVGDTVELAFRGAPGIRPRRARIRELFPGPAGPTADIEVEDLVRGKVKRISMWTAVGNLVPSGAPPHLVARTASKMRQGVGDSELQYITLRNGRDSHHLANETSHCLR